MEQVGPTMVSMAEIEALGRQIGEEYGAERVILFGSYAYGTPGPDSDVDLLVVMPEERATLRQAATIRAGLYVPFPLDILVRSPEQLRQRIAMGDQFLQRVVSRGRMVHPAAGGATVAEPSDARLAEAESPAPAPIWAEEWAARAESHFHTMERLYADPVGEDFGVVCDHARLSAEQYLQAKRAAMGLVVDRIGDLTAALAEVEQAEPHWQSQMADLTVLARYGEWCVYPGSHSTVQDALDAVAACRRFRTAARLALGLPE